MEGVARPLGLDPITAAAGILKIVNTNMAVDLRLAFQSRGEDPRRLRAARLRRRRPAARRLSRARPRHSGRVRAAASGPHQRHGPAADRRAAPLSALRGRARSPPIRCAEINGIFAELRRRALDDVAEEGLDLAALRLKQQFDLRYPHQGYHLTVDGPDGEVTEAHKPAIKSAFDDLHRRTYGASAPDEDAELVTLRLLAEIPVPHLRLPRIAAGTGSAAQARIGLRPLFDLARGDFAEAAVYDRARLRADDRLDRARPSSSSTTRPRWCSPARP